MMPSVHGWRRGRPAGNIAMVVAFFLSVLIALFAFVVHTGYTVAEKHRYQFAVDAAAMAGALALCDPDPLAAARDIAVANGCPDSEALTVQLGFYDELGTYDDFAQYKDFQADPDPETPYANEGILKNSDGECHFNNAVLVRVDQTLAGPTGGLAGGDIESHEAAVAYLERYAVIAGKDGMAVTGSFGNGYPWFKDCAIHANGDIAFLASETFEGDARVSATGTLSNCPIACSAPAARVRLTTLDQDLERLRAEAETAGTLIQGASMTSTSDTPMPPLGHYSRMGPNLTIRFDDGDHEGRVYFIDVADSGIETIQLDCKRDAEHRAYRFTLATNADKITIIAREGLPSRFTFLGGSGKDTISIYAAGEILFQPIANNWFEFIFEGGFFRCRHFNQEMKRRHPTQETHAQKLRIMADKITYNGAANSNPIYDGIFGPPCPPYVVRLGTLDAPDD